MLQSVNVLKGYVLSARDGELGRCKDFLFDDHDWVIRYMVADTGKWLPRQKVLISPISLGHGDWANRSFHVRLSKEEIKNSPPLDQDAPVSRQYEMRWFNYFGWPYYWMGDAAWGLAVKPHELYATREQLRSESELPQRSANLRSVGEVTGYHIHARDKQLGHVEEFIVDDDNWKIRYLAVDTRNWLPGRKVLIAPSWVSAIDWAERRVSVTLDSAGIKRSPEYNPAQPINREYEARLYDFYGRPRYWEPKP